MLALPTIARERGFATPGLDTRFDSLDSLDVGMSGAALDWFPRIPESMGPQQDPTRSLELARDPDSTTFLRLNPDVANCNWTISTFDHATRNGRLFTYGYFSARLRFEPRPHVSDWSGPAAWPAFWLTSPSAWDSPTGTTFAELDVFELVAGEEIMAGTLHEWKHDTADGHLWADHRPHVGRLDGWHDYGVLWEPGRVTWCFDGEPVSTRTYGRGVTVRTEHDTAWTAHDGAKVAALPEGTFACLDEPMNLILGTGPDAPMDVHSVCVWTTASGSDDTRATPRCAPLTR